MFVVSCPFIKYHCKPVSLFFTFSHQVFICIDKILLSLLFFKLNRTISLSPSSYAKSLKNLHSTMELACSSMPMSILFWKAQWLTLQISPELTTGEGSLPITCCQHFSYCVAECYWSLSQKIIAGLWSICCPPGHPAPSLQRCFPDGCTVDLVSLLL